MHRLLLGDCLEQMRALPDASVDTVLTDPPYSSGTRREAAKGIYGKTMQRGVDGSDWFTSDCLTTVGFTWLMRSCAVEWFRLVKPGGHILVFIDWRMQPHLAGAIESADLRNLGLLIWNKTYYGLGAYFRNQYECILHFTKGRSSPSQRHDVGNVIDCKPIRGGVHPTEKPVDLLKTLLSVVAPPGGTVLDPFAGSGTTGLAAAALGLDFIGIERDERWYKVAAQRLESEQCSNG